MPYTLAGESSATSRRPIGLDAQALVGLDGRSESGVVLHTASDTAFWFGHQTSDLLLTVSGGAMLQTWSSGSLATLDAERIAVTALVGPAARFGGTTRMRTGLTPEAWAEVRPSLTLSHRRMIANVGPLFRTDGVHGASAELSSTAPLSRRQTQAVGWTETRVLPTSSGPFLLFDAALGAQVVTDPRWVLDSALTASVSLGPSDTYLPGVISSGTSIIGAQAGVERVLNISRIRVLGAIERGVGSVPYTRARLLIGARFARRQRELAPQPTRDGVAFWLHAPDAADVAVLCSCADWQRVQLTRRSSGWWYVNADVEAGSHQFVYHVDGELLTPTAAAATASDELGGRNGLMWVPDKKR